MRNKTLPRPATPRAPAQRLDPVLCLARRAVWQGGMRAALRWRLHAAGKVPPPRPRTGRLLRWALNEVARGEQCNRPAGGQGYVIFAGAPGPPSRTGHNQNGPRSQPCQSAVPSGLRMLATAFPNRMEAKGTRPAGRELAAARTWDPTTGQHHDRPRRAQWQCGSAADR
jgi:hypothetical protein